MTTIPIEVLPSATAEITSSPAVQRNPARRGPVVLAVDGTETAKPAVLAARALADRLNVPLRVVTVVEPAAYHTPAVGMWPIPIMPEVDIRRAREQGVRRFLAESLGDDGWVLDVRVGQTSREIRTFAGEIDSSVIVMAAAPHRLFGQTIAGARAAQVLRGARCPVLSVAPTFAGLPRTVVAAVDFSPASIRAAQGALLLAADGATVTLVHVTPMPGHARTGGAPRVSAATMLDRLREQLARYTPAAAVLDARQLQGEVVQQLLECADSLGADLMAVGTHGPAFVERMFLGSTAANTLHLARCTVLAAPAPAAAEALELELHVQGTATLTAPDEWSPLLDAVSRRNAGRVITMEVDDRDIGAQVEASGYLLRGMSYDPHDQRVAIMLEAPPSTGGGAHLTRAISNVNSIGITTTPDGRDSALAIKHGRGQTLLFLSD